MRRTSHRRAVVGVALVGAAVAACDVRVGERGVELGVIAGRAEDTWTRRYAVAEGGRLEVRNINGAIRVEAGDGRIVDVTAERIARAASEEGARDLLAQLVIQDEATTEAVRLETRAPARRGFGGHEVRYTIRVPPDVRVDLRTTNGGIHVSGLASEVRATAVNGGVTGRALRATIVEGRVTNGGVDVEIAAPLDAGGRVELGATNGGVRLALPAGSRATLTARASNGGVRVEGLPLTVTGERSRRRVDGTLNGGGARIELSTVNGGVHVRPSDD